MKKQGILLILLIPFVVFGQNFVKTWEKCFGGTDYDNVQSIIPYKDGYLFFGTTYSDDGDVSNSCNEFLNGTAWLVNIDAKGEIIFDKSFCGFGGAAGKKIISIDSGFYLIGSSGPNHTGGINGYWLAKADTSFNIIWEDVYGGSSIEDPRGGCLSHNGGIIEVGISSSSDGDKEVFYGSFDDWAVNLSPDGSKNWVKTYGNIRTNEGGGIIRTNDEGYMLTASGFNQLPGNIYCEGHDGMEIEGWAIKLDDNGNIEWNQCYGGSYNDYLNHVVEIEDGYIFIGASKSADGDLPGHYGEIGEALDIWLVKTNKTGGLIWSKNFGGTEWDIPYRIFENENNTYTIFGKTKSHDYDVQGNNSISNSDIVWMFKINEDGDLIYQMPFSSLPYVRNFPDFIKVSDYKYIAAVSKTKAGCYSTPGIHNEDIYIFEIQDMDEFIPSQAQGNSSVCLSTETETYYSTELVIDTMGTQWLLLPEEAGEITEMHDSVLIAWNPNFQDTAWLQVRAVNEYGESAYSAPKEIIVYPPLIIADITGPDSLCSASNTQTIFTTTLEVESQEINWYLHPETAGTIQNQQDTAIITWNPTYEGQVSLKTGILNKCDIEEFSNEKEVLVRTCLGVGQEQTKQLILYPNPATNQITFELPNINKQSQIQIKDIYGKVITTLNIELNQSKLIWECSGFASGVYFYKTEISGEVYLGKFLLK